MARLAHVAAILLAALAPLAASAPAPADMDQPRWADITFSGSGCPQGHAPKLNSGDGGATLDSPLTFTFDGRFRASTSPDKSRTANCQAHITTRGGSGGGGWQLALADIWVDGKGRLAPKSSLDYYTTLFFSADAAKTQTLGGTVANKLDQSAVLPLLVHSSTGSDGLWSACSTDTNGNMVNVNFRIALLDDGSSSFEVKSEKLAFKWRRC